MTEGLGRKLEALCALREKVHAEMQVERAKRLEDNPIPSEEELRAGAFKEDLEPQVRDAAFEMLRKGYGTQSSGFYGDNSVQAIDGYFTVDADTVSKLKKLGVEVLKGADIGLPENKLITMIRFYPEEADIDRIKETWDTIAALLPDKGSSGICERAEEFRVAHAPDHASLQPEIDAYFAALRKEVGV